MIQLQDNNDVQFCNTTNLDNELQKNLEENENNDENVTNEQVHHNDVQLEENENNNDMLNYIPSNIYDFRDRYETHFQEMLQRGIIVEGNKAYVTGYTCDSDVVEIPEIIEVDASELGQASNQKLQLPVIGIGENAFTNYIEPSKSDIKDYTVKPLGMSSIDKLSKVIMPDTIEFVLEGAFNNVGLKEVKISNNMKILSSGAFASNSLRSISLPDSLLSIGISTFVNNQLEEVELPRNLKFIDNQAFAMNHLKTITVPSNIATIESFAFSNNQLNEVILSEGLREIKEEAFAYNDIKTITIPSTVQNIESRSLYENPNLHTIVNKTRLGFDWYNICFGVESDENFSTGTIQHWDGIHNVTITSE